MTKISSKESYVQEWKSNQVACEIVKILTPFFFVLFSFLGWKEKSGNIFIGISDFFLFDSETAENWKYVYAKEIFYWMKINCIFFLWFQMRWKTILRGFCQFNRLSKWNKSLSFNGEISRSSILLFTTSRKKNFCPTRNRWAIDSKI